MSDIYSVIRARRYNPKVFGLDLAAIIQLVGYPGLFLVVMMETGTPLGVFFPGSSMLFTAGFLASQGFFNIYFLALILGIAAILGDSIGYWIGAKWGVALFDRPDSRFFKREHLEKTRRFYAKYGTRTVLIARFIPFARTFAPMLAGIAQMEWKLFLFYNIIGGFLWASGVAFLGWGLGAAVPQTAEYIEVVIIGIIVVSLLPVAYERFRAHKEKRLPAAIIFDLDGTLAHSFEKPSPRIMRTLEELLELSPIAIMTGAHFDRIRETVITQLSPQADLKKLFLFPQNGTQGYVWREGAWSKEYDYGFDAPARAHIIRVIDELVAHNVLPTPRGQHIVDHGGFIALACLGKDSPKEEKDAWDRNRKKRNKLVQILKKKLPESAFFVSGRASIDIVPENIDKAYAVRWLATHLNAEERHMLFVGDALYPGGNDYVVVKTGVDTRQVRSPEETQGVIDRILAGE